MDEKPDSAQPLAAPGTSEPRRAEDELRESEERFRDVIEHAPIGMALTSPDGRFIRVNRALCEIVGYTAEELLKLTFEDITHPDDRQKDLDQVKRLESGEIPAYEMEKRYVRKNGEVVWVQLTGSLLRDAQGLPLQLIKQVQNITERKWVEEKLRAASHYARSLIEASLDPLVTISNEGIITDVNAASELATGIAREDLIGTDFASYFTEPEKAREGYLKVFSDNLVKDYPLAIRHVSGKVMDVLYNAAVYRNESGEVQGVFAAARDITERKRAEEQLRAASHYARSLIEASLDPLATISNEGLITDVNAAFEQATGIDRDTLIGTDFASYFTDPGKAREGYLKVFSDNLVKNYPLAIRHVSGKVMDVLYNAAVYRNESGEVQGVFAAARDITERKRLEEALRRLNQNLEQRVEEEVAKNREKDHILIQQSRLAAMGEMVHNIAHQWRQPLNALSIILSNIQDDYDYHELSSESLNDTVSRARQLLQRMSTTVDDFRDFFRPDREPGEFDMSQSVEDALFVMEASLKNNNILVEKSLPKGLMAYGYSNQFAQTILNVFANAKEAIQQHQGPGGRIEVTLSRSGDKGVLTIQDNGGGIPEDVLPKIFDPYFTTKEKGSGIGLYMSKMIIERNLNGTIVVANRPPGALITIALPVLPPAEAQK